MGRLLSTPPSFRHGVAFFFLLWVLLVLSTTGDTSPSPATLTRFSSSCRFLVPLKWSSMRFPSLSGRSALTPSCSLVSEGRVERSVPKGSATNSNGRGSPSPSFLLIAEAALIADENGDFLVGNAKEEPATDERKEKEGAMNPLSSDTNIHEAASQLEVEQTVSSSNPPTDDAPAEVQWDETEKTAGKHHDSHSAKKAKAAPPESHVLPASFSSFSHTAQDKNQEDDGADSTNTEKQLKKKISRYNAEEDTENASETPSRLKSTEVGSQSASAPPPRREGGLIDDEEDSGEEEEDNNTINNNNNNNKTPGGDSPSPPPVETYPEENDKWKVLHPAKDVLEGVDLASPPLMPPDFQPMPPVDRWFRDDHVDPDELVYQGDINRDDLLHHPMSFNLCFNLYAGLQLNSFTTSGVIINPEERTALWKERRRQQALREKRQKKNGLKPSQSLIDESKENSGHVAQNASSTGAGRTPAYYYSPMAPNEFLFRLISGDSLDHPLSVHLLTDRYFVENMDPGIFTARLCDYFVELMHLPNMPPLVVAMFNWQSARFTMRCLFYRSQALKTAKRKLVILSSEGDPSTCSSFFLDGSLSGETEITVTYLANHPLLAHWYGVNGNVRHERFTTLPIGFLFFHRSGGHLRMFNEGFRKDDEHQHVMYTEMFLLQLNLNKMFPHIPHPLIMGRSGVTWLEDALDIFADGTIDPPVEWISLEQLPERVTTIYIVSVPHQKRRAKDAKPSLTNDVLIFKRKDEGGNAATTASQHIALVPFTVALYHKLQQHPYGDPTERELKVVTAFSVWDWRKEVMDYFEQNPKMAVFPKGLGNGRREFFSVLNNYTFVMSPMGYGYDCYRTWEALAFGAIPILQNPPAYEHRLTAVGVNGEIDYGREVQSLGMVDVYEGLPVIKVDDMMEINEANLKHWRDEIYLKFKAGGYQLEKLFSQYWIDRIYGHTNTE